METIFTDSRGRRWLIQIDQAAIHRVKQLASIDLLSIKRGVRPLPAADSARTALAVWAIVKTDAQHAGIAVDDFTAAVADPTVQAAAVAAVLHSMADQAPPDLQAELAREAESAAT